jgi:tetratricopeptide (TPR) repeat protein
VSHIPESELALYAFDDDGMPERRRLAIERHTASCSTCRDTLDFFALAEDDLSDGDVWERAVSSPTLDALRALAERIEREDQEARDILAPLFASPAAAAWTDVSARKRFLTGGVARLLNARAHEICESEPLDALTFADAAIRVAQALPDDTYPARAVFDLRGTAWKERARALHLLGRLTEALDSLTKAELVYRQLTSPAMGLAMVALVRAIVLYEQQRLDEASAIAEEAEAGFMHLGDQDRSVKALFLRASIRFEAQDIAAATELFGRVLAYGTSIKDARWVARASYALGNCSLSEQRLGEATAYFRRALALFGDAGPPIDRVNAEWGIARVFLHEGKHSEAIHRLRIVVTEFESRGMVTDAALAGLHMADALLAIGRTAEIGELAARLFRVFADAGMLTGALTAIAYVKEAADAGALTPRTLEMVRVFLKRAERQPELVFAPPPATFR